VGKVGFGAKTLFFWERWNAGLWGGKAKGLLVLYTLFKYIKRWYWRYKLIL